MNISLNNYLYFLIKKYKSLDNCYKKLFSSILIWVVVDVLLYFLVSGDIFFRISILTSSVILFIEVIMIIKRTRMLFSPIVIFLLSFFLFQSGNLFLLALNVDVSMHHFESMIDLLPKVSLFTSISNVFAGLAGVMASLKDYEIKSVLDDINVNHKDFIANAIFFPLVFISIILVSLSLYEFFVFGINGGRYQIVEFESNFSVFLSFIRIFRLLYGPFIILFLTYSRNKKSKNIFIALGILWAVFETLNGNRTNTVALILGLILFSYYSTLDEHKRNKISFKIIVLGLLLMFLIVFVSSFRITGNLSESLKQNSNFIVRFISELGGSSLVLFTSMSIVPSVEGFLYGKQFLFSFLKGIIPSVIDFTGIIGKFAADFDIFDRWMTKYFSYNFGLGQSINQEAYINFGWFGLIAIFFICYFIFFNLSPNFKKGKELNKYALYKSTTLLMLWVMLPRQSLITMWNGYFWGIIVVVCYIKISEFIFNKLKNKRK